MNPINSNNKNLFELTLDALLEKNVNQKIKKVYHLYQQWQSACLSLTKTKSIESLPIPGRPAKPILVDPKQVKKRNFSSLKGRLVLVHAITHIEFNAINLALDAIYRFQKMPSKYYSDWCRVAKEEVEHFEMLSQYLQKNGVAYGNFSAHNGLWEMAVKTDKDVLIRMALVPRVLEARGLDVTPKMIKKLKLEKDYELVSILEKIFEEEIGHVKIGSYWFNKLCHERGLNSEEKFFQLIKEYMQGAKFGAFETEARLSSGFTQNELDGLRRYF